MTERRATTSSCAFCLGTGALSADQVLEARDSHYLCVPRGQIVEGYVTIAATACGEGGLPALNHADQRQLAELRELEQVVEEFYRQAFGAEEMTFYEQGRGGGDRVADETSGFPFHAHYCGLPCLVDPGDMLRAQGFEAVTVESIDALPSVAAARPYLFVRCVTREGERCTVYLGRDAEGDRLLEGFRLKDILCELLGIPERAYWRDFPGDEEVASTIRRFARFRSLEAADRD